MSRTWVILAIIVAAGLGVRLSYLASQPHDGNAQWIDGELARSLVGGHGFTINERASAYTFELRDREHRLIDPATVNYAPLDKHGEWQPLIIEPPGGGVLLAVVWEIAGREYYLPMQILQAIVDALCALLIFRISLRLFKRRNAALAAAALYAVYLPIAWQTTIVYNDFWTVDFTIAIVAVYLEAIGSAHRWRWLLACGLLAGVGVYFRPFLVFLPAILALATISGVGWRQTLGRALVPTAIALALIVPWTIRNYHDFHTFIFIRTGLGATLWDGLSEVHNSLGFTYAGKFVAVRDVQPNLRPESVAWDDFLLNHFAIPTIENHPFYYAKTVGRRIVRSSLLDYDRHWMRGGATVPSAVTPAALASFVVNHPLNLLEDALQPLVFLLAMLTMGLTWRRWRRQHVFLTAVLLGALAPYIVIHVEPRYILAAACAYVVWIGLGIDLLAERAGKSLRTRRTRLPAAA